MKDTARIDGWTALITVLIILETSFLFFFRTREYPRIINEIVLLLISLGIGCAIIGKFWKETLVRRQADISYKRTASIAVPCTLLIAGIIVFCMVARQYLIATPIDPNTSDIIPMIQVAVRRLLAGEQVYKIVTEWGGALPLTYLPLQWLPFSIAALLSFDFRWVAIGIFLLAIVYVSIRSSRNGNLPFAITVVMFLFAGWMILQHEPGILTTTVELMVAGYYMFFVSKLSDRNPWLLGLAIAVCLLSRYSLVLWLPLWTYSEWIGGRRRQAIQTSLVAGGLVLIIYIIPFLSNDWGTLSTSYSYYTKAAIGEWQDPNAEGNPAHLYLGVGFARWFYEYLPAYSIPERVHLLQRAHLFICLFSVMMMGVWYRYHRQNIDVSIFQMASFKIYLTLFLYFIQVPYIYLMITGVFVSIAIFAALGTFTVASKEHKLSCFAEKTAIVGINK